MATALVIGATGLVGTYLIQQLLEDPYFDKIVVFTRRTLQQNHPKLTERIVSFDDHAAWEQEVKGDVLFSTLGTTLKKAGSKEAQYTIDYTYQYRVAVAAAKNGVARYVLVSAAYASADSKVFYSRMKGVLERDIKALPFTHISIIRPGILAGGRKEKRAGEKLGLRVAGLLQYIPGLRHLRPIHASVVATAMINAAKHQQEKIKAYTLNEVFDLAEKKLH